MSVARVYRFVLVLFMPLTSFAFRGRIRGLRFSLVVGRFLGEP